MKIILEPNDIRALLEEKFKGYSLTEESIKDLEKVKIGVEFNPVTIYPTAYAYPYTVTRTPLISVQETTNEK